MCFDTYGTNTGSTATVRNAEGLVQIEMRHITAKLARMCSTNHRIEIRAININLTAGRMNPLAHITDFSFKDTVS